ncbi:odorant receptor 67c-like isoform X2 [Hermetia illucens]|uniref:odorant receptor 67c-like isoform X2 n=1 Tax=Hermetia illucens TaxID=343691 RepID=UPI0018CC224C|nr:odorant receptor 67c-like isoform X2 [Hermetia illucens]
MERMSESTTVSVSGINPVRSLELNVFVAQIFGVPVFFRETHLYTRILVLNVLFRIRKLQAVLEEVRGLPSRYVKKEEQHAIFRTSEIKNKLIVIVYSSTVTCTCLAALFAMIKEPTMGGRKFPFRAHLPDSLPMSVRILYWWFAVFILGIQIVAIDSINILLVNQIQSHLKFLTINFSDLTSSAILQKDACSKLAECLEYHQLILRIRDDIENLFKYPILFQFFVSLLVIVVTGFQAIVLPAAEGGLLIYFYCSGVFFQLFSICWFTNQVMEENKLLVQAGYDTAWFEYGDRYCKMLLIFMINAQKPLTFTIGGFSGLSLNTFSGVLSRSYSYIAVLRQVYA